MDDCQDLEKLELIEEEAAIRCLCKANLYRFVRTAWPHTDQGREFKTLWHQQILCEHLQAFYHRQIKHLVVNMPPGIGKSVVCSILFPAWAWANDPANKFLCASHRDDVAVGFARKTRYLLESEWYKPFWQDPEGGFPVRLRGDSNTVQHYENTKGGWRLSVTIGSGFSVHPMFVIIDDPYNPEEAASEKKREFVERWFIDNITTRGISLDVGRLINMQRLHQRDLCELLEVMQEREGRADVVFLKLPMEYDPKVQIQNPMGLKDFRTIPGQLLCPEFVSAEKVKEAKKIMPAHKYAGQFQQQPTAAKGDMIQRPWLENNLVKELPPLKDMQASVRFWDKAYTDAERSDWTVGVLMTFDGTYYYVVDICRFKAKSHIRDERILQVAEADIEHWPNYVIALEEEYGPGKQGAELSIRSLAGFRVRVRKPRKGKPEQGEEDPKAWEAYIIQLAAGNIKILDTAWTEKFIDEHCQAPNGEHDDQIDAASGALEELAIHGRRGKVLRPLLSSNYKERMLLKSQRRQEQHGLAAILEDVAGISGSRDWAERYW